MPVVEFASSVSAPTDLLHIMFYPNDSEKRRNVAEIHNLRQLLSAAQGDDASAVGVSNGQLRIALTMPSLDDIESDRQERTKRALIAGELLNTLYLMHHFNLNASMNRAIYAVQSWTPTTAYGDGTPLVRSETSIRKCWLEFPAVAHFWAALRINKAYPYSEDRRAFTEEGFPKFLSVSATLYDFAVSFVAPQSPLPKPLVDPAIAWAPPAGTPRSKFAPTAPPEGLTLALADYKAPIPNLPSTGTR